LEEAVEPEVFHSQTFKQTNQNSFLESTDNFRFDRSGKPCPPPLWEYSVAA